ncbi:MAG: hypothetical protein IJM55_03685 [Ruminococcus sp.]|jgi:hypothetical protein|nr:hypothetical protein [Ruminococcus sp.]
MKELLNCYQESRAKVLDRIHQLTSQRNALRAKGDIAGIAELDLERRIKLLYTEHEELSDIVRHLDGYVRRAEERVET